MIDNKQLGKLIQCHIDINDPETFVAGILSYYDDNWILLADVSPYGESNGFALYQRKDLVCIEENSDYIKILAFLIQYNHSMWTDIQIADGSLLNQIIMLCIAFKNVVGIETYASGYRDVNGFIEEIDVDIVRIRQIDEFGRDDGCCWLDISSITRMLFDDKESKCLEILYNEQGYLWGQGDGSVDSSEE